MSDNPNEGYYRPSLGSLTGFETIHPADGSINLAESGWSLEQIRKFLLNEGGANFASEEWVLLVNEAIQEHIQDIDNPHRVTLEQVTPDFVAGVLENLTTGTAPDGIPIVAFDSACPLPMGNVYPAEYTTTNVYRVLEGGAFIDPTTESEILGVCALNNVSALPLFGSMTNTVPANWYTRTTTPVNTTITPRAGDDLVYPFPFYAVGETNGSHRSGLTIPSQQTANGAYTATFFVVGTAVGGSLRINQSGDTVNSLMVDLETGEFSTTSDDIVGKCVMYTNEVIKVSLNFVSRTASAGGIDVIHVEQGQSSPIRDGEEGRIIFHIAYPLVTTSSVDHPIAIDATLPALTSPLVFDMSKFEAPTTLPNALVNISLDMSPMAGSTPLTNNLVLDMGLVKILRDRENLIVSVEGVTVFTSKILEGLNVITLSYSPTKLIFKDLATPRKTRAGQYPALSTATLKAGPCTGYLRHLAIYAFADRAKSVEFLTNG